MHSKVLLRGDKLLITSMRKCLKLYLRMDCQKQSDYLFPKYRGVF